jgi:aryl-alcohol dehydrogenase-like predicted oxidoreductase
VKYRKLGRTDLSLSEVGFGVWTVATNWWGKIDSLDAERLLQEAFNLGVNFFDTADTYGLGLGEQILPRALKDHRHEIIIGSKFGYDWYDHQERTGHKERPQRWDSEFIRYACVQSLQRLRTDYIDVYELHNPRLDTLRDDEIFDTLDALVKEGKVRFYGVAIGPDIGWEEEGKASMLERDIPIMQIIYNIIEQEPARTFFPAARRMNTGLLSRVPHASDVLTDKYANGPPEFDPSDHRAHRRQEWLEQAMRKRHKALFVSQETGRSLSQAAIQFCLSEPTIASVLPNITNLEELREFAATTDTQPLTLEEVSQLHSLYDTHFGLDEPSASPPPRQSASS